MGDWERTFGEAGMRTGEYVPEDENHWSKKMSIIRFPSADKARQWAKKHPGQVIKPDPKSSGFIADVIRWSNGSGESYYEHEKEAYAAWYLEQRRKHRAASFAAYCMGYETTLEACWLYDNGYVELLTSICGPTDGYSFRPDIPSVSRKLELALRLRSLVPCPFPENYKVEYKLRQIVIDNILI